MNFLKRLFRRKKTNVIYSVTCGERDENGFAYTYVNGEKTNIRMLLFTREEIEKLQKIAEKIHEENIDRSDVEERDEQLFCDACGKQKEEGLDHCTCYEGENWVKKTNQFN